MKEELDQSKPYVPLLERSSQLMEESILSESARLEIDATPLPLRKKARKLKAKAEKAARKRSIEEMDKENDHQDVSNVHVQYNGNMLTPMRENTFAHNYINTCQKFCGVAMCLAPRSSHVFLSFHRKLRNMEGPDKVSLESSILRVHNTLLSCSGVALQPCTVLVQTSIYLC